MRRERPLGLWSRVPCLSGDIRLVRAPSLDGALLDLGLRGALPRRYAAVLEEPAGVAAGFVAGARGCEPPVAGGAPLAVVAGAPGLAGGVFGREGVAAAGAPGGDESTSTFSFAWSLACST